MNHALHSLMEAANRLTIDAVAQFPYSVMEGREVSSTYAYARQERFSLLPVEEADGIHRVVETARLEALTTWKQVIDQARVLKAHDIVSRHAPLFSVLSRFEKREILFTLGSKGIDGVVTLYDLNQPAAHLVAFGMALVVEKALGDAIGGALGSGATMSMKAALLRYGEDAGVRPESLRRLRDAGTSDEFLDLLSCLQFRDKVAVLKQTEKGMDIVLRKTATRYGGSKERLLRDLDKILGLRNAVAHSSSDLYDYERTCARMLVAYEVALLMCSDDDGSSVARR